MWIRLALAIGGTATGSGLLLLAELALRIGDVPCGLERDPFAGFSNVVPMFEPGERPDGTKVFRTTAPHRDAGEQQFLLDKPAGGFRAFVVGESSAAGVPYARSEGFSSWLERRLRAELPQVPIEVVNAAQSGYASRRIAAVVHELASYAPDLLIVYCGHNEYGERRFYAHLLDMDPRLFRIWETVAGSRLFCVTSRILGGAATRPGGKPAFEFSHLDNATEMFVVQDRRLRGERASDREVAFEELHYRHNLEDMARTMAGVGARTMFVTLSQNFSDWAPAASSHRADLTAEERAAYESHVAEGDRLSAEQASCEPALDPWREALAIDDGVADLHWRIAGCERALGRLDDARASYRRASDLDGVPHGAPTRWNALLAEVARETGSLFVDAAAALEAESGSRLVGDDLFTDMMHPNLRAHQRIARTVAEGLRDAGMPRPAAEWRQGAYVEVDPEAVLAAQPHLRIQEHLVRAGACLLAWREECADREAVAALALDPEQPSAKKIRDGIARRRARRERGARAASAIGPGSPPAPNASAAP
jgi:lysophospholipase L1-like esterase